MPPRLKLSWVGIQSMILTALVKEMVKADMDHFGQKKYLMEGGHNVNLSQE